VLEWNESAVPERLARIARTLGSTRSCADAVRELRHSIGLPEGLSAVGVTEPQLDRLADLAFEDPCHSENPRPCSRDDLLGLYRKSL
jgi:alcohol dehydrogenase class IV